MRKKSVFLQTQTEEFKSKLNQRQLLDIRYRNFLLFPLMSAQAIVPREYNTATDSFYMIDIINRIEESHAFNLSRESLKNLFLFSPFKLANNKVSQNAQIMWNALADIFGRIPNYKKIILVELVPCSWIWMELYHSRQILTTEKSTKVPKNFSKSNNNISFAKVV